MRVSGRRRTPHRRTTVHARTAHARHGHGPWPCPWPPRSDAAAGARPRCRHGDTDRAHGAHRFRVTTHLRMHARRCEYRRGRLPSVHMFSRTRLSLPLRLRHVTGCTHAASSDATCVDTDEPLSLTQPPPPGRRRMPQKECTTLCAPLGCVKGRRGHTMGPAPARQSKHTHTRTKTRNKRSCLTASAASQPAPPHSQRRLTASAASQPYAVRSSRSDKVVRCLVGDA